MMIERGFLMERITPVLGPVKRREVYEEWYATPAVANWPTAQVGLVPRLRHLTLFGEVGVRQLCRLSPEEKGGRVGPVYDEQQPYSRDRSIQW